jgi:hypothetical protein
MLDQNRTHVVPFGRIDTRLPQNALECGLHQLLRLADHIRLRVLFQQDLQDPNPHSGLLQVSQG